ncbi:FtsB family cell division protein [Helcococcus sueciensis]|uniref:FtsB family cell division protein n=1 Tax=Helcococcus sueciensis TaxID=241555 RepID=UPI0004123261|nr:septum formation initiator family protein [Helcococcus sueciensis]
MDNKQAKRRIEKNRRKKRTNRRLNILFLVSTIITVFLMFTFIGQRIKIANLNKESKLLKVEQENLEKQIDDLVKEIKEVNSLEYIEKKARQELGMIKKDENIYVNPDDTDEETKEETSDESEKETDEESSN